MTPDFLMYIRHLSEQDRKSFSQRVLKVGEEFGELARVSLSYDNAYATTHRFFERERLLEEAMDTVLCAMSVAYHLKFTDVEIDDMLQRKAEKWAKLQINEADVKYPLPYECHITVKLDPDDDINTFRDVVIARGMKPIILDLQDKGGASVMQDVMTSSKHFGDNRSVYEAAQAQVAYLRGSEYNVVRVKIETVPWHPAAPKTSVADMPANCYFEAHIPVTLSEPRERDALKMLIGLDLYLGHLHLSNNVGKVLDNGQSIVMLTYRRDNVTSSTFTGEVSRIGATLIDGGFTIGKIDTEFAVYDTNVSHDNTWITSK